MLIRSTRSFLRFVTDASRAESGLGSRDDLQKIVQGLLRLRLYFSISKIDHHLPRRFFFHCSPRSTALANSPRQSLASIDGDTPLCHRWRHLTSASRSPCSSSSSPWSCLALVLQRRPESEDQPRTPLHRPMEKHSCSRPG